MSLDWGRRDEIEFVTREANPDEGATSCWLNWLRRNSNSGSQMSGEVHLLLHDQLQWHDGSDEKRADLRASPPSRKINSSQINSMFLDQPAWIENALWSQRNNGKKEHHYASTCHQLRR